MIGRWFDKLLFWLGWLFAGVLLYIMLSVDFEVVSRYFFASPTKWVVDFTEYSLVYLTFLSTAWVLSQEKHVKIDLIFTFLRPGAQRILNMVTSAIGTFCTAIFFWFGLHLTLEAYAAQNIIWRGTMVPAWPVYAIIPFGSLILTIQFIRRTWFFGKGRSVVVPKTMQGSDPH